MKHLFYVPVLCLLILSSCSSEYKKGLDGLEYKINSDGKGQKVVAGDYVQMHITQIYKDSRKDSILSDTRDMMPVNDQLDSATMPPPFYTILAQARIGDSIIVRSLTDSVFKGRQGGIPPYLKKGTYLYSCLKILNIFKTAEQKDSANKAELKIAKPRIIKKQFENVSKELAKNKDQIEIDTKIISDYLAKNNITAIKATWGTFVAIHTEGTGEKIDNNSLVMVNYTGRTLDSGRVFDSNTDPAFKHAEPYQVSMMQLGSVVLGWSDAFFQLKKGSKATIYIPSTLEIGRAHV